MFIDALDYAKDVACRLGDIPLSQYFHRTSRETNSLVDEEWPLATLGKILYHPNRIIDIEYFGKSSVVGYDAKIRVTGSQKKLERWDDETPVEITTAYYKKAHLVREELAQRGSSYGPHNIFRNKGVVESSCSAVDINHELTTFIPEIICSLQKKYDKPYPENTIILCALYGEKSLCIQEWAEVVSAVKAHFLDNIKYPTYLIDTFFCRHFSLRKTA